MNIVPNGTLVLGISITLGLVCQCQKCQRMTSSNKFRGWCFTLNNYTDAQYEQLRSVECKYLVVGKEVGESGTPHLQGYVYFENALRFDTVKGRLPGEPHIEAQRGSNEQAIAYCKKDAAFEEFGEPPMSQKRKGELNAERWALAKRQAIEGKSEDIDPQIYIQHYSSIRGIMRDHPQDVADADDVTGVWIYGVAGVGKSRYARENYPKAYLKAMNKWWDGYRGEENVILDDVDPSHSTWIGKFIKDWTDRYAFPAEIKGFMIKIRPKKFIITSQYSIDQIWQDEETRAAVSRRCHVIHMPNFFTG